MKYSLRSRAPTPLTYPSNVIPTSPSKVISKYARRIIKARKPGKYIRRACHTISNVRFSYKEHSKYVINRMIIRQMKRNPALYNYSCMILDGPLMQTFTMLVRNGMDPRKIIIAEMDPQTCSLQRRIVQRMGMEPMIIEADITTISPPKHIGLLYFDFMGSDRCMRAMHDCLSNYTPLMVDGTIFAFTLSLRSNRPGSTNEDWYQQITQLKEIYMPNAEIITYEPYVTQKINGGRGSRMLFTMWIFHT